MTYSRAINYGSSFKRDWLDWTSVVLIKQFNFQEELILIPKLETIHSRLDSIPVKIRYKRYDVFF